MAKFKLALIIPHYREPREFLSRILASVEIQQRVDLSTVQIIVVNDDPDYSIEAPELCPHVHSDFIMNPGKGVSAARNAGLRMADSEYVMFCDCDDMFANVYALNHIYDSLHCICDVLTTPLLAERFCEDGTPVLTQDSEDLVHVHGKVYRRAFLLDEQLFFDESMSLNEDCLFNVIALNIGEVAQCNVCCYVWRYNEESVTRRDPFFIQRTYASLVKVHGQMLTEFCRRGREDKARAFMVSFLIESFYTLNHPKFWTSESGRGFFTDSIEALKIFVRDWGKYWNSLDLTMKGKISDAFRRKLRQSGMYFEYMTFESYLASIGMRGEGGQNLSAAAVQDHVPTLL